MAKAKVAILLSYCKIDHKKYKLFTKACNCCNFESYQKRLKKGRGFIDH